MRIGIIKYDNNDYHIDLNNKKLSVKKITNKKVSFLSKKELNNLIKDLFDSNLTYKTKAYDYEIFEDEVGNKRFFKDGKENFYLFFIANGENALEYVNKSEGNNDKRYKKIKLKNKAVGAVYIFIAVGYISMFITSAMSLKNDIQYATEQAELQTIIENYDITSNQIVDGINRLNISDEQKKYLCNNDFFDDIIKVFNNRQKYNIDNKLKDIKLTYFTESQKESSSTWMGQYNPIINRISLRDNTEKTFNFAMAHELIHLLQENNQYSYINEATATILANEYYNGPQNYNNEVKNIKFLMELIGPKPILECSFKGDTRSFENKIHEVLNEEDANELLNIFSSLAEDEEEQTKKNEALDRIFNDMCNNIYKCNINDDKYFKYLKENEITGRIYFNEHDSKIKYGNIIGSEIDKTSEIITDNVKYYKCNISETKINEENADDKDNKITQTSTQETVKFNNFAGLEEFYNRNSNDIKNNKYYHCEFYIAIDYLGNEKLNQVYCDVDDNGKVKLYAREKFIRLPSILNKFPEQYNNLNRVDNLFESNKDSENNSTHTR